MSSKAVVQQGQCTVTRPATRLNRNGGTRSRRPPMTYTPSKLKSDYALDMAILDKINQNGSLDVINSQIKEVCQRYLMKNSSKGSTKSATRRSLDSSETSSHRNTVISPPKKLKLQSNNSVTADLTEIETLRVDSNSISCNETNCEVDNGDCCSVCDKIVADDQQGLFCESCSFWYHASCCGIDESGYQTMSSDEGIEFRCPNCVADCDMISNEDPQALAGSITPEMNKETSEGTTDPIVNDSEQGQNLIVVEHTNENEQKEPEAGKNEEEIAYTRKLKDLIIREKDLNKREKTLRKKEYDTDHLSQQLTTAKALVVSLENKVLDIRKENDNLKTHLLASNSTSQSNIGYIQPQVGTPQMETNLTVRLQAIENELLRMRLNMQDRAFNVGVSCNTCSRTYVTENKISNLETKIMSLESENRLLGNRLSEAELKLRMSENEIRLRQTMVTPSYFHTGYNLQYMPVPVNKQTVVNTKTESSKVNTKVQKGCVTNQRGTGRSSMASEYKNASDCNQNNMSSESDRNDSIICVEDSGENQMEVEQQSKTDQNKNIDEHSIAVEKGNTGEIIQNVNCDERKSEEPGMPATKNVEHKKSFLSQTQPQLHPPWYQMKNPLN